MVRIAILIVLLLASPAASRTKAERDADDVVSRMAPADPTCMTDDYGGTFRHFAPRNVRQRMKDGEITNHYNRFFNLALYSGLWVKGPNWVEDEVDDRVQEPSFIDEGHRFTIWHRCVYEMYRRQGVRSFRSLRRVDPDRWALIEAARDKMATRTGKTR
jgi:hypothetical protein